MEENRIPMNEVNNFLHQNLVEIFSKEMSDEEMSNISIVLKDLESLFDSSLHSYKTIPDIPREITDYNPFRRYKNVKELSQFRDIIKNLPIDHWGQIVDLFETLMPPSKRLAMYNRIRERMPLKGAIITKGKNRGLRNGWFRSNRDHSNVCTVLFPSQYRAEPYYGRLFPAPMSELPESPALLQREESIYEENDRGLDGDVSDKKAVKSGKVGRKRISILSGTDRSYKRFILNYLNMLMSLHGIRLRFVEIDLVSCHARILTELFPERTPELTRIFVNKLNLWKEIISSIPRSIVELIEKKDSVKAIVKIVAYKTLQIGSLEMGLKDEVPDRLSFLNSNDRSLVLSSLSRNAVLKEFCSLQQAVTDYENRMKSRDLTVSFYSMFDEFPLSLVDSRKINRQIRHVEISEIGHGITTSSIRCCSFILVSIEFISLLGIIKALSVGQYGLPVILEHDGCLCLVDERNGPFDVELANQTFQQILKDSTNLSLMEIELKSLDFDL